MAAPLLLYSPAALAWDGLAHEAICEIAFLELNDTARQRVIALIQQDPDFNRASCNWADREPRQRPPKPFVNLPRDAAELGVEECPLAEKCVVTAIEDDLPCWHRPMRPTRRSWLRLSFSIIASATSTSPCTSHSRTTEVETVSAPQIGLRAELLDRIETINRELAELRTAVEATEP
jgi:hypothetical protein